MQREMGVNYFTDLQLNTVLEPIAGSMRHTK